MDGLMVLALLVYPVPTVLAWIRDHPNTAAIAALNLLLGWTFFGWAAAVVWALTGPGPRLPQRRPRPDRRDDPPTPPRV